MQPLGEICVTGARVVVWFGQSPQDFLQAIENEMPFIKEFALLQKPNSGEEKYEQA